MKILGRDPTLILAFVASAITTLSTLNWNGLTPTSAALLITAVNAVFAAINAWTVRPIQPAVYTYAVGALATLAAHYGFEVSQATLGAINGLVIAGLALITYGNVTPQETPLTRS